MIYLDSPKGLGDAIYVRAIALHLLDRGEAVTVFTRWPDAFADLPVVVATKRTGHEDIRHCSACLHCRRPDVPAEDIFLMACRQAGLEEPVKLEMRWTVKNETLIAGIGRDAGGRKILVYQPPKIANGPEQELLKPRDDAFVRYLNERQDFYRVKLGHPDSVADADMPCERDLFGKTSVSDVFDIGTIGTLFFGEPSYLLIMAQAMGVQVDCMFSRRAASAVQARVRNLSPERFFHHKVLTRAIYDESAACAS